MTPRGVYRATCLPCGNGEAEESIQLGLWQRRGVRREGAGVLRATSNSRVEDGEAVNLQTCNYICIYIYTVSLHVRCLVSHHLPLWAPITFSKLDQFPLWSRDFETWVAVKIFADSPVPSLTCFQFQSFHRHLAVSQFPMPWTEHLPIMNSYSPAMKSGNHLDLEITSYWPSLIITSIELCSLFFSLHHPALEAPISLRARQRNSNPFMPHRLGQKTCWKFLEA